jgi:hypothetical protein
MPLCAPEFLKKVSPALKKRMQGKSCFNFTSVDAELAAELDQLTSSGIEASKGQASLVRLKPDTTH